MSLPYSIEKKKKTSFPFCFFKKQNKLLVNDQVAWTCYYLKLYRLYIQYSVIMPLVILDK